MDVNSVFLYGDLLEEVFMKMPLGFFSPNPNTVCHLQKSLYGLREAPWQWFAKLYSKLYEYGFVQPYVDYSLFVYRKGDTLLAALVYVDDIVLASNDTQATKDFKSYLHTCFSIKDLGPVKYFLDIELARGPEGNLS